MKNFSSLSGWLVVGGLHLLAGGGARAQAPAWQTAVAGSSPAGGTTAVSAVALDAGGNVYLAGSFDNTATFGATTLTSAGGRDGFVAKWSSTANGFAWAQSMGGIFDDKAAALAVSGTNVYVAGDFYNSAAFGGVPQAGAGFIDGFVAKFTDAGSSGSLAWVQPLGGPGGDEATALAVSGTSVYVAGNFFGAARFGSLALSSVGSADVFVAKLTDAGASSSFSWAQPAGGANNDFATALALNGGTVYVAGIFAGTADFGAVSLTSAGSYDAFVTKLADAGATASFGWSQRMGGRFGDYVTALAVSGPAVYAAGTYGDTADFGPIRLTSLTRSDLFVTKIADGGASSAFGWTVTAADPMGQAQPNALAANGPHVYVTGGLFNQVNFGSTRLATAGGLSGEAFLARITDAGAMGSFAWAQQAGNSTNVVGNGVALRGTTVYMAGALSGATSFSGHPIASASGARVAYFAALTDANALASSAADGRGVALVLVPNPAHGRATVQLPPIPGANTATLTLLDALGRTLHTQTAATNGNAELDLTGLPAGLYAVCVTAGSSTATRRLVVE